MSAEKANSNRVDEDISGKVLQFIQPNANGQLQQEETIDLKLLLGELLSKWYLLLIAFIVGAALYGAYTFLFIVPQYQGKSMIYVYSKSTSITSLADLQIGTQLTSDFTIIAKTREVVEQVISDLNANYTYEELVKKIKINNPDSSRVLEIVVTDPYPENAAAIANDMAVVLSKRIAEVTNTDEPSIVQKAIIDNKKVSPSYTRNCLIGGLALLAVALIIIIAIFLMDDTIKTEDDVQKYLGLNTLAMIPVNRNAISIDEAGKQQRAAEKKTARSTAKKAKKKK